MVSGIVASVQRKEIAGKIVVAKGEKLATNERNLVNIWIIAVFIATT